MTGTLGRIRASFAEIEGTRIVPPTGFTASLTVLTSAAMAFLAVFALALLSATDRLADRWGAELARTATIRISAPEGQVGAQVDATLAILEQTPGVGSARAMSKEEQAALLAPWFGSNITLDTLPVPKLIEIVENDRGLDMDGLRLRLQGEVPGARLDDHTRWRQPLIDAAGRMRTMGVAAIVLIAASSAALVTLAASTALSANDQVLRVLRLIGARDVFVVRAFVRRYTLRALLGATAGTALATAIIALFPRNEGVESFLTSFGFRGWEWIWPLFVPPFAAATAFWATRFAAFRKLGEMT
ncbi:MAG: FtsX-like permease family protein [Pseudomonadota bacterium]